MSDIQLGKLERINIRLDPATKRRIERAAAADQRSVTSFIISSAIEKAESVIRKEESTILSERDFDRLMAILDSPPNPNKALRRAVEDYCKMKFKSDA